MNPDPLSALIDEQLDRIREHYDRQGQNTAAARDYRHILADYYNLLIPPTASVLEIGCGAGDLLSELRVSKRCGVDLSAGQIKQAKEKTPDGEFYVQAGEYLNLPNRTFDYIIISETVNLAADVQKMFENLSSVSHHDTRLIINIYNSLWRPLVSVGTALGLRLRQPESNWLSKQDITGLLYLSRWELIRSEARIICPLKLFGLERLLNRFLAPVFSPFCFTLFLVARLLPARRLAEKTVSVVIPARNEAGSIEAAVARTPCMGVWTEIIFIENNSTDNTWEEMQRVAAANPDRRIKTLRETVKGKTNAVRVGFREAEGELLMILDADLTTVPEELPKFYEAVVAGRCDFCNGSRLVYPMDEKAMRFFNLCANKLFGVLFSWLLGQPIKDTLCGTKVFTKENYEKIAANRSYFGDFDPFGDFDLLFGASKLNLKILDLPVRYKERFYGETNIQRWKQGWLLFKMVGFAALKLKFV